MTLDGYDQPIELVAALTMADDGIEVDYAGTSPVSRFGINIAKTYCEAYTCFGLARAIAPEVPNNAGSLSAFSGERARGLHPQRPLCQPGRDPPRDRQMLPDVVFGCLEQATPNRPRPRARPASGP